MLWKCFLLDRQDHTASDLPLDRQKVIWCCVLDREVVTQSKTAFVTSTAISLSCWKVILKEVVGGGGQKPCRTFGTTFITTSCRPSSLPLGVTCSCSVRLLPYSWAKLIILGCLKHGRMSSGDLSSLLASNSMSLIFMLFTPSTRAWEEAWRHHHSPPIQTPRAAL